MQLWSGFVGRLPTVSMIWRKCSRLNRSKEVDELCNKLALLTAEKSRHIQSIRNSAIEVADRLAKIGKEIGRRGSGASRLAGKEGK